MNTGIGDAVNLAWKLADVLHGRANAALLDTYEPERIAFARRLVSTTDQAFTAVTSDGALARFVRLKFVPIVLPSLFRFASTRRFMFRTISQIVINYRNSALSAGQAGQVHGGDRLPWVKNAMANGAGTTSRPSHRATGRSTSTAKRRRNFGRPARRGTCLFTSFRGVTRSPRRAC
jgi:2-polyprenyl-6-methoxyphenol hydroxylase and related FAD-dependent oxidoreductases